MNPSRPASNQTWFIAVGLLAALASCGPSATSGGGGGGTGTGGSSAGGGTASSGGGAGGGGSASSGFWFQSTSGGYVVVTIGFAYNEALFPGQGASYIQPDGGQPPKLVLPVHESLMETDGPLTGNGSIDATQSGNVLTVVLQAAAATTMADAASSVSAGISNDYSICYGANAGAMVDFAFNCSGAVATTGNNGIITAAVDDSASHPPCSNGLLVSEGTTVLMSGWTPDGGNFSVPNVTVANGAACTNVGNIMLSAEGGEVNGTGATGTATATFTLTVTATAH